MMKFIQTPKPKSQPTMEAKDFLILMGFGILGLFMFFGLGALIAVFG